MRGKRAGLSLLGLPGLLALLLFTAGCATSPGVSRNSGLDPAHRAAALRQAKDIRAKGYRLWCVPFARTASGIDIRGNAGSWWRKAENGFDRGHDPKVGAVLAFRSTRKMPLGHVAVVSKVLAPREILVDQANWHRNEVSLEVPVIDVSPKNDWTAVRVAYRPNKFGSVYPVYGFISAPAGSQDSKADGKSFRLASNQ